ncbi:type II toxin-antitoxin system RelE/ParE family toxin [Planosporangium flavigriseum]|uniref:mRNA-degrading endonuclease RelE, toxin component of the RelBE toxin-antitoxin system n=1 Tax=Planosporangium flavigriseum TaxID=373681 RepID=A0A8J3LIJ5_9ACTN|nr:type II toxin-antitoxin system RelE/ParE family toxin [Planosporangium flavigriseum]GIG73557.1 hypothetical protein Pfl04_19610 [Planosporangium flavigriseum]
MALSCHDAAEIHDQRTHFHGKGIREGDEAAYCLPSGQNGKAVADEAYRLSLAPAARRSLTESPPAGLPLAVAVAAAVGEFISGPLLGNPHRAGKALTRDLAGYHSARRGAYRVVYRIDDDTRTVHVVRIDHRADVYHS